MRLRLPRKRIVTTQSPKNLRWQCPDCPNHLPNRHRRRPMNAHTFAPLTAEQFNEGAAYTFRGVPIVEDENAAYVFAYGHVDPETFAEVVNDYDRENLEYDPDEPYTADEVEHRWAVTTQPADHPDGWAARWGGITEDTWGTFPVTVVSR